VGFLTPLALDVRKFGDSTDSTLQAILVAITVSCGALYVVQSWLSKNICNYRSRLVVVSAVWWLYLLVTLVPIVHFSVDLGHYIKVLLPYLLYGIGLLVVAAAERRRIDPGSLLKILVWASIISTLWRVVYAIAIAGLDMETVRWQILGPGIPLLIGFGCAALYLQRSTILALASLSIAVLVVLLSITRSFLISAFLVAAGLLLVEARWRSMARAVLAGLKWFAASLFAVMVLFMAGAVLRPGFAEVWTARLFHSGAESGVDLTLLTRLAEYSGQMSALTQDVTTLLIGKGMGAMYYSSLEFAYMLPFMADEPAQWVAGHSTWVYPIFASGVVFGLTIPVVSIWTLVTGLTATSPSGSRNAIVYFAIYLAYLGQSLTSQLFGERYGALILGVVSGALFVYSGRVRAGTSFKPAAT